MKVRVERFPSGKVSGITLFWGRYRTYISYTTGWTGEYAYRYDLFPRFWHPGLKWWHRGGLMLLTTRIEWQTNWRDCGAIVDTEFRPK